VQKDNPTTSSQGVSLIGQGIITGPPPQPTLTGYCFGSFAGTNLCGVVKDVTSLPSGAGGVASRVGERSLAAFHASSGMALLPVKGRRAQAWP
jgi:hypothetical protein